MTRAELLTLLNHDPAVRAAVAEIVEDALKSGRARAIVQALAERYGDTHKA